MKVPLSWLAEYVDLPSQATPETVMAELVKVGLEEEGSHGFEVTGPVVVGQVLEFTPEPQSNGKTIRWCQVRVAPEGSIAADGGADVRGIVCGASNFEVGDKVVVCLPGAVLPGNFAIAARSTYGHISDGMMASGRELGLSDDHAGILRLGQIGLDPKVGTDALELLSLGDTAAEVNVTPDRGYCFSIRGIAREYAHATGSDFKDPIGNAHPEHVSGFEIRVDDAEGIRSKVGCDRFVARVVRGIDPTRPTPAWMVARLKLAGMRSISLIVDISNYVMLELGQPNHTYDLDKLDGGITVRRAKAGESIVTLDGQTRKLDPEDLLITDNSKIIGLAGVMGAENTEVSNSTVNVLVEAAHFDPVTVARSARRHKLISEASKRFERGVDTRLAEYAVARVVQLLEVHAGGEGTQTGGDLNHVAAAAPIFLPAEFTSALVGVDYSAEQITKVLDEIGCVVAHVDGGFEVIPPSWRPDITHKTDLAEEVARIIGYHQIPSRLPVAPPGRGLTPRQRQRRQALNALVGAGYTEVLNYPFVSAAQNQTFAGDQPAVALANALQEESSQMRLTMLPGLIDAAKRNISRGLTDVAIFEEGSVFLPDGKVVSGDALPSGTEKPTDGTLAALDASIPQQPRHLAILLTGERVKAFGQTAAQIFDYADAIEAARLAARAIGVELDLEAAEPKGYHPGRTGKLSVAGTFVGYVGELDPSLAKANDINGRVAVAELNLEALYAAATEVRQAKPIYAMPAATQDLSLLVDAELPAATLQATLVEGAGELLEAIRLVEDYRGQNIPEGKKSLTFALRFRAPDRTLTQVEASESRDKAVALAGERFGAQIRA
jgi:phenylalanyl-tRNA synthetase beta chain